MEKNQNGGIEIPIHVDTSELDGAIEKAERLNQILKEAKSLAGEIASSTIHLKLEI